MLHQTILFALLLTMVEGACESSVLPDCNITEGVAVCTCKTTIPLLVHALPSCITKLKITLDSVPHYYNFEQTNFSMLIQLMELTIDAKNDRHFDSFGFQL